MAKKGSDKKEKGINTLPFYIALIVLFVIFIYFQGNKQLSGIVGIVLFLLIVVLITVEVVNSVKEAGVKRNLIEIAIAVILVIVFWFGLRALLNTNYPLDVVPSCSMLPQLKRGDLIVLQGVSSITQLKAPIINISSEEYNEMQSNIQNEFLSCVAYIQTGNRITISQMIKPGYSIGLYKQNQYGGEIVQNFQQAGNLIKFTCGSQEILYNNGTTAQEAYLTALTINGSTLYNDINNSIIVYQTIPKDYFYSLGDSYIVHRAYAILNVSGNYYVLTKGDNNPGLDLQYGNYPVNITQVQGRELFSIPYLGYLKLVLSNSFSEPGGCNSSVVQ